MYYSGSIPSTSLADECRIVILKYTKKRFFLLNSKKSTTFAVDSYAGGEYVLRKAFRKGLLG